MEVMEDAVDMTSFDQQPYDEATFSSYWFFVIFILVGSFFSLNLFIGVIIENFNSLKKKVRFHYWIWNCVATKCAALWNNRKLGISVHSHCSVST